MKLSEEEAMRKIEGLISEIGALKQTKAFSDVHTRWLSNALALLEEIFGTGSRVFLSFAYLQWRRTGSFIVSPWHQGVLDYSRAEETIHHRAYLEQLDTAKGLLESAIDQVRSYGVAEVYRPGPSEASGTLLKIIDLMDNKLRKTLREPPKQEKDLQDKFEDLLTAQGIRYLREQDKIVYSSKTYHPDFSFPEIETVLEIKLCDKAAKEKLIIREINDDTRAYMSKYPNLLFLVYDIGFIRDVDRFKDDIEAEEGVIVRVVKH